MRITHRYLRWDSYPEMVKPVRAILDKYNISYKYKEDLNSVIPTFKYFIEFHLYEDNPNFAILKNEIESFGIEPQTGTIYCLVLK